MKIENKINKLSQELKKHVCKLPAGEQCICIEYRAQINKYLEQVYVDFGLDPELIGRNQGSTEPF